MIPRTKPPERRHAVFRATSAIGVLTAGAVGVALVAPGPAGAAAVNVSYGSCASTNPQLAPAPAPYSSTVTLTPSATTGTVGQAITITWHQSISTAPGPTGIPVANAATAKAKIVVGGATAASIAAGPSASFPPAPVAAGATFQIPDFKATFTPTAAGTYTFTPGDNEEDALGGIVITCKAGGAAVSATVTVSAASTGGTGGSTPTSTPAGSHGGSSSSPGRSSSSATATTGGATTTGSATDGGAPSSTATSSVSTLPHTGFNGLWLVGGMAGAAALGAGGLYLTRRRAGHS